MKKNKKLINYCLLKNFLINQITTKSIKTKILHVDIITK
jgi:hypothetical protein